MLLQVLSHQLARFDILRLVEPDVTCSVEHAVYLSFLQYIAGIQLALCIVNFASTGPH